MSGQGRTGLVATSIGVAAGAGAAQLGLGYGLGIIVWLPSAGDATDASWSMSLAWTTWIAATATIAGAVCAARLATGTSHRAEAEPETTASVLHTGLFRAVLAVAAALGALVTVALVAVPARVVTRAEDFPPQVIAAGYAVVGVLIGLLAAIWALSSPAVARNIVATAGWLWSLALIAVVEQVLTGRGLSGTAPGLWQPDGARFWFHDYFYWPGAILTLGSALVIGMFAARSAARVPRTRVGATISGIAGPLLVTTAYFLAAPRLVGARPQEFAAHLLTAGAVVIGLIGSALVAGWAQHTDGRTGDGQTGDEQAGDERVEPAPEPTGKAPEPAEDQTPKPAPASQAPESAPAGQTSVSAPASRKSGTGSAQAAPAPAPRTKARTGKSSRPAKRTEAPVNPPAPPSVSASAPVPKATDTSD